MLWRLRRAAVSTFVVLHLAALTAWNLPGGAVKERAEGWARSYMLPTGLWQEWGMFAPDPVRETVALEVVALDRNGRLRTFAYPRAGDHSPWRAAWLYRHPKYAVTMSRPEAAAHREFAARDAARRLLDIPAGDFPVDVQLLHHVRPTPLPGETSEPSTTVLGTFRFVNPEDAKP